MIDIWKNDKNYYKETIDFELCYCRDFGNEYQLEISAWTKKEINLYLWLNKREIVGTYLRIPKELFKKYEQKLVEECIENKNNDFRNSYDCILLEKAQKILTENGEKITKYRTNETVKQLRKFEIEKDGIKLKEDE